MTPTSGEYLWEVGSQFNLSYSTINATTGALGPVMLASGPAGNSDNYPSIVIAPSGQFLYTLYSSFSELLAYQMSGPGLVLKQLSGVENLPLENSVTIHPSGKFLYVVQSGSLGAIQEITLNTTMGVMTPGPIIKESADLRVGTIDSTGKFLFVNDLTGGRIFVYQVSQVDGSLSSVAGSPFTLPSGEQPTVLAIGGSTTNLFLYANLYAAKGIAAFSVNSSTGALSVIPGSPFLASVSPDYIRAAPSGKFLYSSRSADGSINGLVIDPATGALTAVPGPPSSTAPSSDTIAIDQSGKFLYVANYGNSTMYGFSLDATTGALSPLSGSPFPAVPQPEGLTLMNIP